VISSGKYHQVQRTGNPLINELLVGTGSKDRFSMDQSKNDSRFASYFLGAALARILNAASPAPSSCLAVPVRIAARRTCPEGGAGGAPLS
jgi:hypothetical protein